jgi:DNA repair exonuclease SbcCD ATPase subunit
VEKTIQMVYEKNYEKLDMFDFSDNVEEESRHSDATKLEEQAMLFTLQNKFAESKHQYETTIAKQQTQVDQLQSRTETQKLEFNTVIGINQKLIQELHLNENVIETQQRQIEKYEMAIIEETRKNLILSDRNEWLEAEIRSKNSEVMRLLKNLAVLLDTRSSARDGLSEKLKQEQQCVQGLRQQLRVQQEALEEEEMKLKRFVDQIMKTNQTKSLELKQIVSERDEMRTVLNEICKTIQLDHLCDTNQYEPLLQKLQKKLM